MKVVQMFSFLILSVLPSVALGSETVDCSSSCADGKVLVSYADGNSITCQCMEPPSMDETVRDPAVQEDAINQDD